MFHLVFSDYDDNEDEDLLKGLQGKLLQEKEASELVLHFAQYVLDCFQYSAEY